MELLILALGTLLIRFYWVMRARYEERSAASSLRLASSLRGLRKY